MSLYGLKDETIEHLIRGLRSGDLSEHTEKDISMFHEAFSKQLEANQKDEDVHYGQWLSGVKTDFGFRKHVLNHAIADWDRTATGVDVTDEKLASYDDIITRSFSDNGIPSTTTARQRASFMENYITLMKTPYDFDNNVLDRDRAVYETRHYFSDELFFESEFGNRENYMSLLTHRKGAEMTALNDMRDTIYTRDQAHEAHQVLNMHDGSLSDAFGYKDSKLKALLVFHELTETGLTTDDRHIYNDAKLVHETYPDLVESIDAFKDAVRLETRIVDAQFTIDSHELVSEYGINDLKESDIVAADWNGYIPKLNQDMSFNGGLLYNDPLPNETSAVTTEMLVGNVVNESAEILQEKNDVLRTVWSVKDFVSYKERAEDTFGRELQPDELVDNLLPTSLTGYDVLAEVMTRKVVADADAIYGQVEMINSYADDYYMKMNYSDKEDTVLRGNQAQIIDQYGEQTWSTSQFSQSFDESVSDKSSEPVPKEQTVKRVDDSPKPVDNDDDYDLDF